MGRAANEQGHVRRLSAFDHEEYTRHLLRLDDATRYLRFGMIANDQFLIDYAQGCSRWDVVIYGFFVDGVLRGAAELRQLNDDHPGEAEAAFSVEQEWRGQRVGSRLFDKIVRAARNRNIHKLHMSCLATNQAMQALARRYEAEISFDYGQSLGIVTPGERDLQSLVSQAMDDANAFAIATVDLQNRTLADPLGWFNSSGGAI